MEKGKELFKLRNRIKDTFSFPLSKNLDNISRTGPFFMYNNGHGSYGYAASYAFGFTKIFISRKVRAENVFVMFS